MTASTMLSDGLLRLSEQPQFERCQKRHVVSMLAEARLVELVQGENLCESDQSAQWLWFVLEGDVKCSNSSGEQWHISDGFIGEEAALDLSHYHNDAITVSDTKALRIPAHAVAKPETQQSDRRVNSMLSTLFSGVDRTKSELNIEKRLSAFTVSMSLLGWLLALLLPWLIMEYGQYASYFSDDSGERWRQVRLSAILTCGATLWAFTLVRPYIAGLFMLLLALVIELVPSTTILSGFASNAFFMTLSLFGLSAVLLQSGLLLRLALKLLQIFPHSLMIRHYVTSLCMLGVTCLLPSNKVRIKLWCSLHPLLFREAQTQSNSQNNAIAFALFVGTTLFAPLVLTGSGANLLLYGLLPHQLETSTTWISWFNYAFVAAIVTVVGLLVMQWVLYAKYPKLDRCDEIKSRVVASQQILGKKSSLDWALIAAIVFYLGAILFSGIHKVDHRLVSLVILTLFLLSNVLNRFHINHTMDWQFLILLGACVGLMKCVEDLKLIMVVNNLFPALSELISFQPVAFIILLSVVAALFSMLLPRGGVLLGFVVIPLSASNGFSPWVAIFVILMMEQCWINVKNASLYKFFQLQLKQSSPYQSVMPWQLANIAIRMLAIAASIPFWQYLELV